MADSPDQATFELGGGEVLFVELSDGDAPLGGDGGGIEAARPGKRILAAALAISPSVVIVAIIWYEPLAAFARAFWPAFSSGRTELLEQVPRPEALAWAGVDMASIVRTARTYALFLARWCGLAE